MLDATQEIIIRESLAATLATVTDAGFIQPSPLYCNDVPGFWATLDDSKDTKDEIDQTIVAACWLYPVLFEDVADAGCLDKPLIRLTYEFYLFRQYGLTREDETATPDIFNSKVLVNHNLFISAWLGIKNALQGRRTMDMTGLGLTGFSSVHTNSIIQDGDIQNQEICQFVNGIVGFSVRLRETVELQVS